MFGDTFKQATIKEILKKLGEINQSMTFGGEGDLLTKPIDAFHTGIYGLVKLISSNVFLPVAYVLFGLFVVMEFYNMALKTQQSDGSSIGTNIKMMFPSLLRIMICKLILDNTMMVMNGIYSISITLTTGIRGVMTQAAAGQNVEPINVTADPFIDPAAPVSWATFEDSVLRGIWDSVSTWFMGLFGYGQSPEPEKLLGLPVTAIVQALQAENEDSLFLINNQLETLSFFILLLMLLVKVVVIVRFIEIYLHIAVAPLALATLPHEEFGAIGKNFFKAFAALCLQGTLIFIILAFFPAIFYQAIEQGASASDLSGLLWSVLGYAIVLAVAVLSSRQLAKSVTNAM